jgi:hypothetical protein
MTTAQERLCIDCDRRPTPKDGSRERCYPCQQTHNNEVREQGLEKAERKTKRKWSDPLNTCRYCTVFLWKHHLVGLTTGVSEDGRIFATPGFYYLEPGPTDEALAKFGKKLRDMNVFQPGFDRDWVKRFKAMVLAVERPAAGSKLDWDGIL